MLDEWDLEQKTWNFMILSCAEILFSSDPQIWNVSLGGRQGDKATGGAGGGWGEFCLLALFLWRLIKAAPRLCQLSSSTSVWEMFSFDRSLLFLIKKGKSLNYEKQPARKKRKEMRKNLSYLAAVGMQRSEAPAWKVQRREVYRLSVCTFLACILHTQTFFFFFFASHAVKTHTCRAATHANEPMNILKRLKEAYMVKKKSIHPHWKEPSTLNLPCVYSLLAKTHSLKLEHFCRTMDGESLSRFFAGALPAPWARV